MMKQEVNLQYLKEYKVSMMRWSQL